MKSKGFTLIELLVVVAIIGILATVVFSSLSQARDRARNAKTQEELVSMRTLIVGSQVGAGRTVREMTGVLPSATGTYASCPIDGTTALYTLPSTHLCVTDWQAAIDALTWYYDGEGNGSSFYQDAWGSPFLLNENEGDTGSPCASFDIITSAGKDGIVATADDISIGIPFETCAN